MVQENQDKELALLEPLEEVTRETTKSKTGNYSSKIDAGFAGAGSYWDQSIPSKRRRSSSNRNDTATTLRKSESISSSEVFDENKQSENLEKGEKAKPVRNKEKNNDKKRKTSLTLAHQTAMEKESNIRQETSVEDTPQDQKVGKACMENEKKIIASTTAQGKRNSTSAMSSAMSNATCNEDDNNVNRPQKRSKTGKETLKSSKKTPKNAATDDLEAEEKKVKKKEKTVFTTEEEEIFYLNETCIARDAGRLYEAKILKVHEVEEEEDFEADMDTKDPKEPAETDKGNKIDANEDTKQTIMEKEIQGAKKRTRRHYFIHYNGWKPKYDIWVQSFELLKKTEENISIMKNQAKSKKKIQEELLNAKLVEQAKRHQEREERKSKVRLEKEREKEMERNARTAAPRMDIVEDKEDEPVKLNQSGDSVNSKNAQLKLNMPLTMKKMLVEDWEAIVRKGRLVCLPKEKTDTITNILNGYLASKKEALVVSQLKALEELCFAVKEYFNAALPAVLLYRQERKQYDTLFVNDNSPKNLNRDPEYKGSEINPVDIYGVEHFLRLFVRLPALIRPNALTPTEINNLQGKLNDFLRYLQKNYKSLFIEKYEERQSTFEELDFCDQSKMEIDNDKNTIQENIKEHLSPPKDQSMDTSDSKPEKSEKSKLSASNGSIGGNQELLLGAE